MFLTQGQTAKYPRYYNPCCYSIENAVKFSVANELLGIVAHTEDLLRSVFLDNSFKLITQNKFCIHRDITQINLAKDLGLIIFCWGDDNNCKATIKFLKEKGLHAIIYDKVDQLIESKVS